MPIVSPEAISDPKLAWFRKARFGMFIHFGLYALLERGEWVQYHENIPREEYEQLMERFNPERFDASKIIFPQDVRNCTKCHSESDNWTENPSRLACLACHDTDAAITHAALQTNDPTPHNPWSGDEGESCLVCHGPRRDYTPSEAHAIAEPFVPPYPREP